MLVKGLSDLITPCTKHSIDLIVGCFFRQSMTYDTFMVGRFRRIFCFFEASLRSNEILTHFRKKMKRPIMTPNLQLRPIFIVYYNYNYILPMDLEQQIRPSTHSQEAIHQKQTLSEKANPLITLFDSQTLTLQDVIQIQDLQQYTRDIDDDISLKILKHKQLTMQLMDCALRPDKLEPHKIKIQWPFMAVQFLTHQQEIFYRSYFVKEGVMAEVKEEQSLKEIKVEGSDLLKHLFSILDQEAPLNQTSAGYMLRIFNQIYYQNQQQFFYFFVQNPSLVSKCLTHFQNPSIEQLLWRIVDTYNQDIESKTLLMNTILKQVITPRAYLSECLQNLQTIMTDLLQRCDEINTRRTTSLLLQQIITCKNLQLIHLILDGEVDRVILKFATNIVNILILFFLNQKTPRKQVYSMQQSYQAISPSNQVLIKLKELVLELFTHWFKEYPQKNQKQSKHNIIVVVHSLLKLKPEAANEVIPENFSELMIEVFQCQPNNNILHNQIKGVLKIVIQNIVSYQQINRNLIYFIVSVFEKSDSTHYTYLNQLYHIALVINDRMGTEINDQKIQQRWFDLLNGKFKQMKQVYQHQWPKVKSSSSKKMFGLDEQVLSQEQNGNVIVVKKYSEEVDLLPFQGRVQFSPTVELKF